MPLSIPKPVLGWIANYSRKNYWRVAAFYELDDLISDGAIKALEVMDRYGIPGIEIDHPHYMALVKTCFFNHIMDLLRRQLPKQEVTVSLDKEEVAAVMGGKEGDQEFNVFINEMPEFLRKAVQCYLNSPEKFRTMRKRLSGTETLSSKLSKYTGFPEGADFEEELRSYIWEYQHDLV